MRRKILFLMFVLFFLSITCVKAEENKKADNQQDSVYAEFVSIKDAILKKYGDKAVYMTPTTHPDWFFSGAKEEAIRITTEVSNDEGKKVGILSDYVYSFDTNKLELLLDMLPSDAYNKQLYLRENYNVSQELISLVNEMYDVDISSSNYSDYGITFQGSQEQRICMEGKSCSTDKVNVVKAFSVDMSAFSKVMANLAKGVSVEIVNSNAVDSNIDLKYVISNFDSTTICSIYYYKDGEDEASAKSINNVSCAGGENVYRVLDLDYETKYHFRVGFLNGEDEIYSNWTSFVTLKEQKQVAIENPKTGGFFYFVISFMMIVSLFVTVWYIKKVKFSGNSI